MVADNIPAADDMDPNLVLPLGHAFAPVHLLPGTGLLIKDLEDGLCRSARGILLVPVVRFDHLDIIVFQELCRFPEELQKIFTPTEKLLEMTAGTCPLIAASISFRCSGVIPVVPTMSATLFRAAIFTFSDCCSSQS